MRAPPSGPRAVFLGVVLLLVAGYLLGERLLAQRLVGVVSQLLDDGCAVSDVRLELPFQVILADVRCTPPPPAARCYAPRMVAVPRFGLWKRGTVHIQSLLIEEPRLVLEASTDTSSSSWLPTILPTASSSAADAPRAREAADARWKVIIDHVRIRRGRLEFVDLRVKPAVRVVAAPLFAAIGPWTNEPNAPHMMSMAAECRITAEGHPPATLRCSGWMDREARGLGLQCGLEGLRLAVLEPYYQGTTQLRAYNTTVNARLEATAMGNVLDGHLQMEMSNLREADVSFSGHTLIDIKRVVGQNDGAVLAGAVSVAGPLDRMTDWQLQLVPSDALLPKLFRPMLDRGLRTIPLRIGSHTLQLSLAPLLGAHRADEPLDREPINEWLPFLSGGELSRPISGQSVAFPLPTQLPRQEAPLEMPAAIESRQEPSLSTTDTP